MLAPTEERNPDTLDIDLVGASLENANLQGADLSSADLRSASLKNINWKQIKSIAKANIAGVRGAPEGFLQWALAHGALDSPSPDN